MFRASLDNILLFPQSLVLGTLTRVSEGLEKGQTTRETYRKAGSVEMCSPSGMEPVVNSEPQSVLGCRIGGGVSWSLWPGVLCMGVASGCKHPGRRGFLWVYNRCFIEVKRHCDYSKHTFQYACLMIYLLS